MCGADSSALCGTSNRLGWADDQTLAGRLDHLPGDLTQGERQPQWRELGLHDEREFQAGERAELMDAVHQRGELRIAGEPFLQSGHIWCSDEARQ
jgi:hypothetical protein